MVVGEAVTVLAPESGLLIEEHLSVTFASHPFSCPISIRPRGFVIGEPTPVCVGAAVSSLSEAYPNGLSSPFATIQLAQFNNWV